MIRCWGCTTRGRGCTTRGNRRFVAEDLVKGTVLNPFTLPKYIYTLNNPIYFIDPNGLIEIKYENTFTNEKDHSHKDLLTVLQKQLVALGYLDMNGAEYGIEFAGLSKSAVQLFQLNYGIMPTDTVDDYIFLAISNTYAIKIYGDIDISNAYYSSHVQWLKYFNTRNGFNISSYRNFDSNMVQGIKNNEISNMTGNVSTVYINRIWYFDYTNEINQAIKNNINDYINKRIKYSYPEYIEEYSTWFYVPNIDTYICGEVLPVLTWFYEQVKPNAKWDLKVQRRWEEMFDNNKIHYYSQQFKFVYRGQIINSEDLGNINFGYLGSALALSLETMEKGVWLAGDGAKDGDRDKEMIRLGINFFFIDYDIRQYPIKY